MGTTDTLVNVMRNMAHMMGKANTFTNITSIEQALARFQLESEKGNLIAEQIDDTLNMGEDMIDDEAADQLIAQVELSIPKTNSMGNLNYPSYIQAYQNKLKNLG